MRRSKRLSFAPGYYSFPGGVVDEGDQLEQTPQGDKTGGAPSLQLLKAAAIRETFEESGYGLFLEQGQAESLEQLKQSVFWPDIDLHGQDFYPWLGSRGFAPDLAALHYQSCWITPELSPKRYETYFFVAVAPKGQRGSCDGREMVEANWIKLQEFLNTPCDGNKVMFPTEMNLRWLGSFVDTEAVLKALESHQAPVVLPQILHQPDGTYLLIPEDCGYDICRQKLS